MIESIFAFFGGLVGLLLGIIVVTLLWAAITYLFWGMIWGRILTKAGFKGKLKKRLYKLIYIPVVLSPILEGVHQEDPSAVAPVLALLAIPMWCGIYYVVFARWDVVPRETPKEVKDPKTK